MNIGLFVGGNNKKPENYLANMSSQKHPFFQTNLLCHFDDKLLILLGFDGSRENYLEFEKITRLSERLLL